MFTRALDKLKDRENVFPPEGGKPGEARNPFHIGCEEVQRNLSNLCHTPEKLSLSPIAWMSSHLQKCAKCQEKFVEITNPGGKGE